MTNVTVVNDLTTPFSWRGVNDTYARNNASDTYFDIAVPSANFGSEIQRIDEVNSIIAMRTIVNFANQQRTSLLEKNNGSQQEVKTVSGTRTNENPNGYLAEPAIRRVNWTLANTFSALQEWEGVIVAIESNQIVASLVDLTAGRRHATEEAHIPLGEINEQDLPRLVVGRVFRWAVGYQRNKTGTKKRVSNIVFRDLPRWTKRDFAEARADAMRLKRFLGTDRPSAETSISDSGQR